MAYQDDSYKEMTRRITEKQKRLQRERKHFIKVAKRNGISPERMREIQRMSSGDPFGDRISANKGWHQVA